jgi:hypothetical protein
MSFTQVTVVDIPHFDPTYSYDMETRSALTRASGLDRRG